MGFCSFLFFFFHRMVFPWIYGLWLPLWYLQAFHRHWYYWLEFLTAFFMMRGKLSWLHIRVITVFTVFRFLTDFFCLYNYEFWLSLCKIVRSSVILLLPLFVSVQEPITSEFSMVNITNTFTLKTCVQNTTLFFIFLTFGNCFSWIKNKRA